MLNRIRTWRRRRKLAKRARHLFFFPNGNTAVTDEQDQLPELQVPWIRLVIEGLRSQGVDIEKCELILPAGPAEIVPLAGKHWNWRFKR